MKKILILMLLSFTTIFTQINAQGFYLSFDGVNDYVSFNTFSQISKNNDFAFSIEFEILGGNTEGSIFNNNISSSDRIGIVYWNNHVSFGMYNGSSYFEFASFPYSTNVLYKIDISYINGVFTANYNDQPMTGNVTPFLDTTGTYIGRRDISGRLANINVYNLSIYNDDFNTLIHDYDFQDGSGTTLTDNVGNNDGTIVGATWQGSPLPTYPADINLTSNYGDYFDADIQFQDQDELYIDYPISAQSADVNDDWQATAPTSNIGSFTFQDWYDLDNNTVFSTNPSLSITGPDRDYNFQARYTGVTEYDIDLNMESGISGNIQYQGNTFNNNTVTQLASVIDQTVPDGTAWQATAPNVAGFTFDHWYDLDSNSIYSTNTFIDITSTTSNFNLEARYSPIPTYTFNAVSDLPSPPDFSYQVNSGSTQSAYPVSITVNENDDVQIVAPTSNIGFYEFDGWYNTSDNSFIQSNATLQYTNITQNISIEARYTLPEEYQIDLVLSSQIGNIQFQIDDQTPIFAPSISETVFAGQDFQATGPSDPSYEFQHWFDLNNNVVFSENLFITAQDVDRDYNLEARYLEIFDITFDTQGGDLINADTALDGEAYVLPTPTREGYIFLGWNDSNDVLPRPIIESPYTITQDVTFIANWVEVIEITFNSNGGSAVPSQNVSAGGVITQPAIPSKFGYIFDGWFTDNTTFANEYDFNSPVNSAFTLHAKWILGSDSDVGETLNTWISNSGISSIFIVLVIMIATSVTLGIINATMFVIIISNLSILFVFSALGYIPLWILLVAGLGVVGFIIMTLFGGSNNA